MDNEPALTPEQEAYAKEFDTALQTTDGKPQPELLLGKFKTTEDLANAYKELEKKLGGPKPEAPKVETTPEEEPPIPEDMKLELGKKPEEGEAVEALPLIDYLQQAGENGGELTNEVRATIKKAYKLDDATLDTMAATAADRYRQSVQQVVKAAGGQEQLEQLNQWVVQTYNDAQIADINKALKNDTLRESTITGLMQKMSQSYNAPTPATVAQPTNLSSGASGSYTTDADLHKDMADERYTNRNHPEHAVFVSQVQERFQQSTHLH